MFNYFYRKYIVNTYIKNLIYLMSLITINKSITLSMFASESFRLINYTLKDIIKLDKYRLKILKNLGKLMK